MNKSQTNHMRMFLNTQESLDANTATWNGIPILLSVKNNFDELKQRIEVTNEKTVPKSKAVTEDKARVLKALAKKATMLAGTLKAYAAISGNAKLGGEVELVESDLTHSRETDVEAMVTPVIKNARRELENLADYNLSEAAVTEVETSLDDFKALIGQPRTIRNQAFAAKSLMEELFDTTNDLLNNRLDLLMLRFKYTNPEFYDQYIRARTIVD